MASGVKLKHLGESIELHPLNSENEILIESEKNDNQREQTMKERAQIRKALDKQTRIEKAKLEKDKKDQVQKEQAEKKQAEREQALKEQAEKRQAQLDKDKNEREKKEKVQKEQAEKRQAKKDQAQKEKEYFDYKQKLNCSISCSFSTIFTCCNHHQKIYDFLKLKQDESFNNKSSIISLILREKENEKFWNGKVLEDIMRTYHDTNDNNIKEFFSILMYDWHEYEYKENKNYFLIRKFQTFEDKIIKDHNKSTVENPTECEFVSETTKKLHCCLHFVPNSCGFSSETTTSSQSNGATSVHTIVENKTIFEKFVNVINNPNLKQFHSTCLKIIYYYVDEVLANYEDNKDKFLLQVEIIIDKTLKIDNNAEYKIKILKIFAIFLGKGPKDDDNLIRDKIMDFLKQNSASSKKKTKNETLDKTVVETADKTKNKTAAKTKDETADKTEDETADKIEDETADKTEDETADKTKNETKNKTFYDLMIDHCDRLFFNLVFLLKDHSIPEFKHDYKNFIKTYKSYFGEYWTFAIKENGRLLYLMTTVHEQKETGMFLLNETGESQLKSNITSIFADVAEFDAVFNEPLSKSDDSKYDELEPFVKNKLTGYITDVGYYMKEINFKKYFSNTPQIRRLLFGRKSFEAKSLFEEILSNEIIKSYHVKLFDKVLNYIWNEFRLWNTPQILTLKNSFGMRYIDYAFKCMHNNQKIQFMNVNHSALYEGTQKPLKCMMLIASLLSTKNWSYLNKVPVDESFESFKVKNYVGSFAEFQLDLIDETEENDENYYEANNLANILYLLEEMHQYCSNKTDNFAVIENVFFFEFNRKERSHFLLPKKHFFLGLMMIHWNYYAIDDQIRDAILQNLSSDNQQIPILSTIPFLYLISLIVTKNYKKFIEEFPNKMKEIVKNYKSKNGFQKERIEHITTNLCFVFLYGAIKANQKEIIKQMFEYNSFAMNVHEFPPNIIPEEIHSFTIKMYLEYKFQLKHGVEIPDLWITNKVMKEFLDSRILDHGNFYKIDCRFLLPHESQDDTFDKPTDDLILKEEYTTTKYFMENYKLKSLVTHPVMEMVLRTKIDKYNLIFGWNLFLFILLYIIPTGVIISCLHLDSKFKINSSFLLVIIASSIRIGFILIREFIQCVGVYGKSEYFRKRSNYIEMLLFLLSLFTLVLYIVQNVLVFSAAIYTVMISIEAGNIILTTFSTVNMYPNFFRQSIYLKCFFKVIKTYFWTLLLLIPLSFGCIAIIYTLFSKGNDGVIDEFHDIFNTILKYFIMYNGELAISAKEIVGTIQVIALLLAIIFVINKANLVLSIVIDDVQKILKHAKEITLTKYANKYIDFAERIRKTYEAKNKGCWTKVMIFVYKGMTRKYSHIHRLQFLYLDKMTGYVYANEKRPLYDGRFCTGKNSKFSRLNTLKLDYETMKEIEKIVEKKDKKESVNDDD